MSGAISIPLGALAIIFGGKAGIWFAILGYVALWAYVIKTALKNHQLVELHKSELISLRNSKDDEIQKIKVELTGQMDVLETRIESLQSPSLEIEGIPVDITNGKYFWCQISVHNKNPAKSADDVRVELIKLEDSLGDSLGEGPAASMFHPVFPLTLKPAIAGTSTINPGADTKYVLFRVIMQKEVVKENEAYVVACQTFIASFGNEGIAEKNTMVFKWKKTYRLKIAVTGRDIHKVEQEFEMTFLDFSPADGVGHSDDSFEKFDKTFSEAGEFCRFNLVPIKKLTEAEKLARDEKAKKAVEELVKFGQSIAIRISHIKGIEATKYNPDTDNETWDVIHQAGAYISLMLKEDAAKVFDSGVFEIHGSTLPHAQHGSTRYEDGLEQTLARLGRRFVNLKTLIDGIDKFIK